MDLKDNNKIICFSQTQQFFGDYSGRGGIGYFYLGVIWCQILFKALMIETDDCTTVQNLTS
jgi:hypothetical protein